MQKRLRRTYTAAIKLLAMRRIKHGKRVADIAQKLDILESTLRRWRKQFAKIIHTSQQLELKRLREDNKRLKQQLASARKVLSEFGKTLNI